ncbi:MAG: hypothetical protein NW241_21765 [Bacteroidia bacterium]|nr:hypothetical protein [Bacteroidia bacterium]
MKDAGRFLLTLLIGFCIDVSLSAQPAARKAPALPELRTEQLRIPAPASEVRAMLLTPEQLWLLAPAADTLPDRLLAAPSDLSQPFRTLNVPFRAAWNALAVRPDGRILLAGHIPASTGADLAVMSLLPDGSPDAGFGTRGMAVLPSPGNEEAVRLLLLPDGQVLLAAHTWRHQWADRDLLLVRLTPGGQPDPDFGVRGFQKINIGAYDQVRDIAADSQGRILLAAQHLSGAFQDMALIRLLPDGRLDPAFARNGIYKPDYQSHSRLVQAIAAGPDGSVYAFAHHQAGAGPAGFDWLTLRLSSEGQPVRSHGPAGFGSTDLGGLEYATDLHIAPDGTVWLLGLRDRAPVISSLDAAGKPGAWQPLADPGRSCDQRYAWIPLPGGAFRYAGLQAGTLTLTSIRTLSPAYSPAYQIPSPTLSAQHP